MRIDPWMCALQALSTERLTGLDAGDVGPTATEAHTGESRGTG